MQTKIPNIEEAGMCLAELRLTLGNSSLITPIWELNHLQRWNLWTQTLLGHPKIRGGLRPRDFAHDSASQNFLSAINLIHQSKLTPFGNDSAPNKCRFSSWLYLFCISIERAIRSESDQQLSHKIALEGSLVLCWNLLRTLNLHTNEAGYYNLAMTLGLSSKESQPLLDQYECSRRQHSKWVISEAGIVKAAAEASFVASAFGDQYPTRLLELNKAWRWTLQDILLREFWLISIKPRKIQTMIERAKTLRTARGASTWIARTLGIVRDVLVTSLDTSLSNNIPPLLLLSDTDTVLQFACLDRPNLRLIRQFLRERLYGRMVQCEQLQQNKPQLFELLKYRGLTDEVDDVLCMPEFSIQSSPPLNMVELCSKPNLTTQDNVGSMVQRHHRTYLDQRKSNPEHGTCAYVLGERGILSERDLPWIWSTRENALMSWRAALWSHAGSSHGRNLTSALCDALKLPQLAPKRLHKEWLHRIECEHEPICYFVLDGDMVGTNFAALPIVERLSGGLKVFNAMYTGFIAGGRSAIQHWQTINGNNPILALPFELIYAGGDDIVCMIPEKLLLPFFEGFGREARNTLVEHFSGASFHVPPIRDKNALNVEQIVRGLLPRALDVAKAAAKNRSKSYIGQKANALKKAAQREGYSITRLPTPGRELVGISTEHFELRPENMAMSTRRPESPKP